jgi:hypothetical protein
VLTGPPERLCRCRGRLPVRRFSLGGRPDDAHWACLRPGRQPLRGQHRDEWSPALRRHDGGVLGRGRPRRQGRPVCTAAGGLRVRARAWGAAGVAPHRRGVPQRGCRSPAFFGCRPQWKFLLASPDSSCPTARAESGLTSDFGFRSRVTNAPRLRREFPYSGVRVDFPHYNAGTDSLRNSSRMRHVSKGPYFGTHPPHRNSYVSCASSCNGR